MVKAQLDLHKLKGKGGGSMPKLQRIENDQRITNDDQYPFLHHLKLALLLALRERGQLNAMQHRYAEEKLDQQRRERAKMLLNKGRIP